MPKNRKRNIQKGAKSISIVTKHKIGGRKSGRGTRQMSLTDLMAAGGRCRKRDFSKISRELARRGVAVLTVESA